MADYLPHHAAGPLEVFYDAPLSLSGELARRTREIFASRGLDARAAAVPVPERELAVFPGAIATSDTALIDAHETVVDLAGEIIRQPEWRLIRNGGPLSWGNRGPGLSRIKTGSPAFPGRTPYLAGKKFSKGGPQGLVKKTFLDYTIPKSNHGRLTQR